MLSICPKCYSEEQVLVSHDDVKHEEQCKCNDCGFEYICPDPFSIATEDEGYESGFEPYAHNILR